MANIRWLLQKDIKSVLDIQSLCPFSPQWIRKDYIEANRSKKNSFLSSKSFPIIYVYEEDKKVRGFITYQVYLAAIKGLKVNAENFVLDNKDAVEFCLSNGSLFYGNIISFCVHPDFRRKGIGKELFEFIIGKFSSVLDLSKPEPFSRPFMLFTKVSEKDLGVLNFLKKMNFQANKISRDYYGKDHDAYNFCFKKLETLKEVPNV